MASLIRRGLVKEGLAADVAGSGEDALWMASAHEYDAIVLDVMLPGLSGFETCRRLRNSGIWAPVLMLTARDSVEDRVAGLDSGSDDYLVKPFAFAELLGRLRAVRRRGELARPAVREGGGVVLYIRLGDHLTVALDQDLRLRAQDLAALARQPGSLLPESGTGPFIERGESYAQLLDSRGRVLEATAPLGTRPLLTAAQLERARRRTFFPDLPSVPGLDASS